MEKRIDKCWINPEGQIIYCPDHKHWAEKLITEIYPNETYVDARDFLHKKGCSRFCDVLWALTGSGWIFPKGLTKNQRETIFALTQEWFDGKMESIFTFHFLFQIHA